MARASTIEELLAFVEPRLRGRERAVIGISGYGGAGKSTLAREILAHLPAAERVRGDDFLDPSRSHRRSTDWDGMGRLRLSREILTPFRAGLSCRYRKWDWAANTLSEPVQLPDCHIIVVDAIGLFHPEVIDLLDVSVWVDTDLATATRRGKHRDRALGRQHTGLWDDVWVPNELDFTRCFSPRERADVLFGDAGAPGR